jgi:hypothetical protein
MKSMIAAPSSPAHSPASPPCARTPRGASSSVRLTLRPDLVLNPLSKSYNGFSIETATLENPTSITLPTAGSSTFSGA